MPEPPVTNAEMQIPFMISARLRVFLVAIMVAANCVTANATEFFVSATAGSGGDGSRERPFTSIEQAQRAVRAWKKLPAPAGGVTIWIASGTYRVSQTLEWTAEDSGTAEAPIVWRAARDGEAFFAAGRQIDAKNFSKVTDEALLARMCEEARGNMWQLDLGKLGVQHAKRTPDLFEDGGGLLDLYCNGARQTISRWPNDAKATMARVLDRGDSKRAPGARGGTFVYREDRPARWREAAKADQLWLAGFWRVAWEWQTVRVSKLDLAAKSITLAQPVSGGIGSKYAGPEGAGTEPWIALNLLEEIDQPGEWSIDFATQTLFWWPPAPLENAEIAIADFDAPVVRLNGAAHLALRGLVIEGGLGNGIEITGGESCAVEGCTLRDLGRSGVVVTGGKAHQVLSCDLHTLGQSGILVGGGDRKTLTPARHVVDNNHLHDYGLAKKVYAPGIGVGFRDQPAPAVGCRITHNLIHDAPHAAVLYGGNDHLFEFNEIHDFLIESDDLGGFYSTFDWTSYGNVVRHNFIHHTPHALGVYLDDGDSGDLIEGNVSYRMGCGVGIGGGHDNIARNNLAIECGSGVRIDARGVSRGYDKNPTLLKILAAMNPTQPPWRDRFPTLVAISETLPPRPIGCAIERNVTIGAGKPSNLHGNAKELSVVTQRDNVALPIEDLGFADAAKLDFRMKASAAVFKKVPGFQRIPFEKIGLYINELRPVLPSHLAGTSKPCWGKP